MKALSVSQLNGYIKSLLDRDENLDDITIVGEISNFKRHSSGHWYFSLKDEGSALSAAMFRGANRSVTFMPDNGMRIIAHGKISVYVPSGSYQIIVDRMMPDGVGALYEAFEHLKEKLQKEGIFAPERKRPIPAFPERIGVVTSPTGAAIRDIISVTARRWPVAEIIIAPVLVQGADAPEDIVNAIHKLNESSACDVMIVGRGGGSIEDLWCFNDERVARAIASSKIPVISAVGHETDYTISDFSADVRAATPSAAAELSTPDIDEIRQYVSTWAENAGKSLKQTVERYKDKLASIVSSPIMSKPETCIQLCAQRLDTSVSAMDNAYKMTVSSYREQLSKIASRLEALNPMSVLARGYSIAYKDSSPVVSAGELSSGDTVDLQFSKGRAKAEIISVSEV